MEKQLTVLDAPELKGLEKSKAEQIKKTFEPMAKMLEGFEQDYKEIVTAANTEITKELTFKAKRLRLDIGKVRIETGKLKDKQKEYIKLEDRAIMGVHNILVWAVKEKEDHLKDIEQYFENMERKRLAKLQSERVAELSKYIEDAHERALAEMDDDVWKAYLSTKKKDHEDRKAAEAKAEADRLENERLDKLERDRRFELAPYAQFINENHDLRNMPQGVYNDFLTTLKDAKKSYEAEQEKIRIENERLKKEAEQLEAKRQAELKAEREKQAKLEAELKAKKDAEELAAKKEAERLESELSKGDADKIKDLISDLEALKTKYSFKSAANKKTYLEVCLLIDKIVLHIKK